ncbi:MAG TPA: hypothetical protein PLC79_07030 [Phycisphaerae bacterium]|nr:hypothetical protein [Phycisphaerae bacterium]
MAYGEGLDFARDARKSCAGWRAVASEVLGRLWAGGMSGGPGDGRFGGVEEPDREQKGVTMGGYLSSLSRDINSASTTVHVVLLLSALVVGCAIAFGLYYWQKRAMLAMFPEVLLMPGGERWRRILGRAARNRSTITWDVAIAALWLVFFFRGPRELSRWWPAMGQWRRSDLLFPFVVLLMLISPLPAFLTRREIRYQLRRELIARGVPVCLNCGCRLPGQGAVRCPRCSMGTDAGLPVPPAAGGG